MLEWGHIRVQSPGPCIGRRTFSAELANMARAVSRGDGRREGAVTTGASSVRHGGNRTPAVRAKVGNWIICQKRAAIRTMNRKKEPDRSAHETWDRFCDVIGHRQPRIFIRPTSLYGEEPAGVKVVGFGFIVLYE